MPQKPYSQSEVDEAVRVTRECGGNAAEAARRLGVNEMTITRRLKRARQSGMKGVPENNAHDMPIEKNRWSEDGETAEFSGIVSKPIRTLEQLLKVADVDRNVWEVDRWECTGWTTSMKLSDRDGGKITNERPHQEQNFRVTAKLRRKCPRRLENAIDALVAKIAKGAPVIKVPKSMLKTDQHMLEIGLNDVHVGKLAWSMETGESYDLKIAEFGMRRAVDDVLADTSSVNIEKIVIPIGQDFYHFDNLIGMGSPTTTNGTPQDVDGRWAKVFEVGVSSMIHVGEACLKRAPVHFLWIPGNHDFTNSYWLARVLQAHFKGCKDVVVDTSPKCRKYIHYGPSLIGLTHGSEERHHDLPTIMANEQPKAWLETTHREWHLGHFHKSKETRFGAGDTFGGVRVKILPALCKTDAWHYKKGYVGNVPGMESYLWSKTRGFRGFFNTTAADLN